MELYHDFSLMGLSVPQRAGIYGPNQQAKAPVISGYLAFAIGKLKAAGVRPLTVSELFCADAYYSFLAHRLGADRCDAFDNNRDGHMDQAKFVNERIGGVTLHETDVFDIPASHRASIVVNAGGLYHVSDPLTALERSYAMCERYLIVQTVFSMATEDENYFETPAPGWTWGCRFSFAFLRREMEKRGYQIVDSDRNILTGNDRPEDRGSAYFLISR
jgi:hypothetical protein